MYELEFSGGAWLRLRPVPTHVYLMFRGQVLVEKLASIGPKPEPPMVEVKMKAGHIERHVATEDTPEYQAFAVQRDEWQARHDEVMADANADWVMLCRDYAVEEWSHDGRATWDQDIPEDWQPDEALDRAGIRLSDNLRAEYINLVLCQSWQDHEALTNIAEARVNDIADEEVAAVLAGFRSGAGRKRDAVATARTDGHPPQRVSRANGGGKGLGQGPGWLVRLFAGRKGDHDGA